LYYKNQFKVFFTLFSLKVTYALRRQCRPLFSLTEAQDLIPALSTTEQPW